MTQKRSSRCAAIAARFPIRVLFATAVLAAFTSGAFTQTVRVIEPLKGDLANDILRQINTASFTNQNTSPILLEGDSVATLRLDRVSALRETYRAGYSIVLLDPTLLHVRQLHALLGEGINYRMASATPLQSYSIRKVNGITTTVLLFTPPSISLDQAPRMVDVIVSGGPAKSVRCIAVSITRTTTL